MTFQLIKDTEVADLAGVGVDPQIERVTKAVCDEVLRSTARTFERKSRSVVVRTWPRDYLFLPEAPIFAVTDVRFDLAGLFADGTSQDLSRFSFNTDDQEYRLFYNGGCFPEGSRVVRVTFDAGYYAPDDNASGHDVKVPEDLRDEMIKEAVRRYKRGVSEKLQSESFGDYSYARRADGSDDEFRRVIRRYRRP